MLRSCYLPNPVKGFVILSQKRSSVPVLEIQILDGFDWNISVLQFANVDLTVQKFGRLLLPL